MNPALITTIAAAILCFQAPNEALEIPYRPIEEARVVPGKTDRDYTVLREFVSPITSEAFNAYVLKQQLGASSYDYDRCPHPPINTLGYLLVIDPKTGYVAPPDTFNLPCPWSKDDMFAIVGAPRFSRSTPSDMPWQGAYPWEKLENAALIAQAEKQDALVVGNWWLLAGWSIRLDVISGHNEFDREVERIFELLPECTPDASDLLTHYEILCARNWQDQRDQGLISEISNTDFSLAMAWLYRSRGELLAAQDWLRKASLGIGDASPNANLHEYLSSSIELEREYLKSARQWFIVSWNEGEISPNRAGGIALLIGELNRQLGDNPAAVFWYDKASEQNMGMLNPELIKRQREMAETNSLY